jgi:hypothetical protein
MGKMKMKKVRKITEDGEALAAVPGMGAPQLASRGVVGSGDVAGSAKSKKKKKKRILKFNNFK